MALPSRAIKKLLPDFDESLTSHVTMRKAQLDFVYFEFAQHDFPQ
jgi:hypothetical protein